MKRVSSLALLFAAWLGSAAAGQAAQASLVRPIKVQGAIDGCSWSATSHALGKGFFFLAEIDQSDVVMNIRGIDTHLKRNAARSVGGLYKLGQTLEELYEAPGTRVEAKFTATRVCSAKDEGCEVASFKAVFRVYVGDKEQTVVGTGDVGC